MEIIADMNDHAPRCIECGYILLGLTELRCPECGTEFDSEYVKQDSYRVHLLPWERPEMGGWIKRLFRTFMLASLHPKQFYDSVNHRKAIRIRKPIKLILAYILAAIFFFVSSYIVSEVISFVRMWVQVEELSQAWAIKQRIFSVTGAITLAMPYEIILILILPVGVMAALISRFFREKIGLLRCTDIAALYCHLVALPALLMSGAAVSLAVYRDTAIVFFIVAIGALIIALMQSLWFCSRRLLLLGRLKTVGMLFAGGIVYCVCELAVVWIALIFFPIRFG